MDETKGSSIKLKVWQLQGCIFCKIDSAKGGRGDGVKKKLKYVVGEKMK